MPEITIFTDAAWMRRADELIAEYSFKSWAGRLALGDLYPPDEAADAEPETAFNSLADLANLPIWVAWREEKKPDGSLTKVPKNPRTGGNASVPTNPRTYGTRAAAERRAEQITKTTKGGIGVVLGPLPNGQHLAAIDLDSCRDVASGAITPRAQEVIRRFNT